MYKQNASQVKFSRITTYTNLNYDVTKVTNYTSQIELAISRQQYFFDTLMTMILNKPTQIQPRRVHPDINSETSNSDDIRRAIARENEMARTIQRSIIEWSSIVADLNSGLEVAPTMNVEWKTK